MSKFAFKRDISAWYVSHDFYGQCQSVEAVFYPKRERYYLGVGINLTFEGCYQLRISDMGGVPERQHRLMLIKSYCNNEVLKSICLDFKALDINPEGPIKLKLVQTNSILEGFINDIPIIDYEDNDLRIFHKVGYGGVWIHPGRAAEVEDFNVTGIKEEEPAGFVPPKDSDLHYTLDIDNVGVGETPPCWSVVPYTPEWTVKELNGKKVFSSQYTKSLSKIHLHTFEDEPSIKATVSFDEIGNGAQAGFLLRHAPDTAYVRVGYSTIKGKWFIEDVPAFYDCKSQHFYSDAYEIKQGECYDVEIETRADEISLTVNGKMLISAAGMRQVEYGRLGLFAEECVLNIHSYSAHTPHATPAQDGVIKYIAEPDISAASMGIVEAPDGKLIGVRKVLPQDELLGDSTPSEHFIRTRNNKGILVSEDEGRSFELSFDEKYAGMCTHGKYVSILRLKCGKYVQVHYHTENFVVSESEDLINWREIGTICSHCEGGYSLFHAQSLAEFTLPDGTQRLYIPIIHTPPYTGNAMGAVRWHNTVVYYSDDGGRTWEASETSTDDLILETGFADIPDYGETKLVYCSDDTLRLYCTRNASRFLTYSESYDFGKTWHGLHSIRHMQCAKSSFSVMQDPYEKGTYYMAFVNDRSWSRANVSARTRLTLARSYDGKNWEFLGDLERFATRIADDYPGIYIPLFQVVDPVVTVFRDYIIVDSGISARQSIEECKPGSTKAVHHEQRTGIIRLEKSKLVAKPWNEYSISDMSLLEDDGEVWL